MAQYSVVYIEYRDFTHAFADGHLVCFYICTIVNNKWFSNDNSSNTQAGGGYVYNI